MPDNDWRSEDRERERWEREGTPPRGRGWRRDLDYSDYGDPAAIYQERSFQPQSGYRREADQGRYENYGRERDAGRYENYGRSRDYGQGRESVFGERETGADYRGGPSWRQREGYDPNAGPDYGRQGFASGRYSQGGYDEPDYEGRGRGPSNFRQGEESYGYGGYGLGASRTYAGGERSADRSTERGEHWWDRAAQRIERWMGNVDRERGWEGHRGRGPKGYTRSDDRIREDAHERLTEDPYVDASEVEVKVEAGEVTLSGTVDSRHAKHHAEHCVEAISGVKHVQNNLRVQTGSDRWSRTQGAGATEANAILSAQAKGEEGKAN